MVVLIGFLVSFFFSYLGTLGFRRVALRYGILDVPDERSMHTLPMPTAGGVGIFLGFVSSVLALYFWGRGHIASEGYIWGLTLAGLPIVIAGFVDDLKPLSQKWKLLAQIIAACLLVGFGIRVGRLNMPVLGTFHLGILSVPLTLLGLVALTNFYNFMDGVDGVAAGEGVIAGTFLALIFGDHGQSVLSWISLAIAGGCLGFLLHNFPPAKIFMGDIGSGFLGFTFGAVAAVGSQGTASAIPIVVPMLLLGAFIFDAGATVVRRMLKGEKWTQPHKNYYCQRLVALGYSHRKVALLEYLVAGLLGISALVYLRSQEVIQLAILIGWLVLFCAGAFVIGEIEKRLMSLDR